MSSEVEDRAAQFFTLFSSCCDAARLGGIPLRLELVDGAFVHGVPAETPSAQNAGEEIDHSGTRRWVEIDDTVVMVERIVAYTVERPA